MRRKWCLERGDISITVRDFEGLQRLILIELVKVRNELRLLVQCVLTGGGEPLSVGDNLTLIKARIN
jgi:hypothetical protein